MADPRFSVTSVTIAISGTVSDAVAIRAGRSFGLWLPVLNGANSLGLMVGDEAADVASANYVDLRTASGVYAAAVASGSCGLSVVDDLSGFASVKVKLSVPQSAARTIKIIQRI